jgi:aspartate racemase
MIGIVGGIGPLAGIDLYKRILEHTAAQSDQDHLPVLLAALPGEISDRTAFLRSGLGENPGIGIAKIVLMLENAGANQIAIACNTAHAPAIFDAMRQYLYRKGSTAEIIHLIDVTTQAISNHSIDFQHIGVLSTTGAYKIGLFQQALTAIGLSPVILPFDQHEILVHESIYELKLFGENVAQQVIDNLNSAILALKNLGAEAVILGCTEIGMVENLLDFRGMAVFNPNTIMARTLIQQHSPDKLKRR